MLRATSCEQHPGDGLKPSLEIAPPSATSIPLRLPPGVEAVWFKGRAEGVPPQAPGSRVVTRVLQTGNHGWKSVMSITLRRPLAALCHPGICRKSHRSPPAHSLPWVHPTLALQLEDLRVETFDVTLPPRTSSSPLNAKTRTKIRFRKRATALLVLRQRTQRAFFMLKEE